MNGMDEIVGLDFGRLEVFVDRDLHIRKDGYTFILVQV